MKTFSKISFILLYFKIKPIRLSISILRLKENLPNSFVLIPSTKLGEAKLRGHCSNFTSPASMFLGKIEGYRYKSICCETFKVA